MADSARVCDPVTVEVVAGAIRALVDEVSALIERTAMSPFVREKKDFHVAVFDRTGRQLHANGIAITVKGVDPVLRVFPAATMQDGDMYWYNDCYQSEGQVSHSPDQVFVKPVFQDGSLVGFVESFAHFNDIGGLRPGTLSRDCTSVFHEGIMVPPVRIERDGHLNEDLMRVFARNSRFPEMVQGDMRSLSAAVRLGARRLSELFARFGQRVAEDAFSQLEDRTVREVRRRAREVLSNGEYEFSEVLDNDGHGNGPFHIRLRMKVSEDRIILDATESSEQTVGPFNFLMPLEAPSGLLATYLLEGGSTLNAGIAVLFDEVRLREGSLLRPRFPAALGLRGATLMRLQSALLGLLAVATRGKVSASGSSYVVCYLHGQTDDGKPFLLSDPLGTGYGAHPDADGNDGVYLPANLNYPAEFVDSSYPIRIKRYSLAQDSGGPGRWRGGCGVVRELEVLAPEVVLAVRFDCVDFPPWGLAGGKSAGRGSCIVNPGRGDARLLPSVAEGVTLKRGDVVRVVTGGGGGWGDPMEREPEKVLEDVLGGFVSTSAALSEYGVVIDAGQGSIDSQATARARAQRIPTKMFYRDSYVDAL